jgi:hypothetical protein
MDEVWRGQFCREGRDNVGQEDDAFWEAGADEVEGGGEDDDIEDVVNQAYSQWRSELAYKPSFS